MRGCEVSKNYLIAKFKQAEIADFLEFYVAYGKT